MILSIVEKMSEKAAIIKEAQKYLARNQIDKAIAEWEKLVKEFPDGNTYNTIGDLYLKKNDKDNAIDSYHKAANFFRQEGFSLKALALYKKILNINSSDAISLIALGELNEGKGLVTDAIKFYLAAADTLSKKGQKEKLIEIYEKILSLSSSNIPLRNKIAEVYMKENLIADAARQYLTIARIYSEKGDTENSLNYYQKTLDIQPVNKDAILGITQIYEMIGENAKAIEQIKEAVSLFPQDTEILFKSAELHRAADRFEEAREYLKNLLEVEPANIKAKRLIADTYISEGNKEKAWEEFLPILDKILLEEKYEDAIKILEYFKDIDPIETGKRLVSLYIQLGDYLQIVRELTFLGDKYDEIGKPREALNCYKEAIKMAPDDEVLNSKIIELEGEAIKQEQITIEAEKTLDEAIIEADIFLRYGLYENAKALLEVFKFKEPENIELHLKLKSLYVDTQDKEQAIAECLILYELYKKSGEFEKSQQVIKEAFEINPEDPRLSGLTLPTTAEEEGAVTKPSEKPSIDDYSEEISEAEFYSRQGLLDEAREILERLQTIFPDNEEIAQKLNAIGHVTEVEKVSAETEVITKEQMLGGKEILEAEEIAEPTLDSDVMDIFNEFKKGLEKELEAEDYETHYNLGIAYKEMGLIDDAIREFQISRNDPKKFISSSNMLGLCYMEKGLYSLAVEVLKNAVEKMEDRGESYWAMKYDLAEAYDKNGNIKEALETFTEVYGWNSKFRDVSAKISQLSSKHAEGDEYKKVKDRKDRVSYI